MMNIREERKDFEDWARSRCISLSLNWDGDEYDHPTTTFAWWGWEAAKEQMKMTLLTRRKDDDF